MLGPFGDYTLLRQLGAGGMSEVFLARCDRRADGPKIVVLKRVLPHLSRNWRLVELFLNEARLAARLHAPNIARVYEAGRVAERDFIAMEFVPGADLARVSDRCAGTPAQELGEGSIVRLARDVCTGLHAAHEARDHDGNPLGLVHGDVHPHNVMLTFEGVAKIIDFGVAQATAAAPNAAVRGTYAYMAPELLRGEPFDRRADVFSVGVLLWELFTGRPLFSRTANYLTLAAVVEDDAPPLAAELGDRGATLDRLLSRALAKSPGDRYASCAELAHELDSIATDSGWDTSPTSLADAMQRLFADEREHLDRAVADAGQTTVEDWLFCLPAEVDISWLIKD